MKTIITLAILMICSSTFARRLSTEFNCKNGNTATLTQIVRSEVYLLEARSEERVIFDEVISPYTVPSSSLPIMTNIGFQSSGAIFVVNEFRKQSVSILTSGNATSTIRLWNGTQDEIELTKCMAIRM